MSFIPRTSNVSRILFLVVFKINLKLQFHYIDLQNNCDIKINAGP
jgi:hypothetical protein